VHARARLLDAFSPLCPTWYPARYESDSRPGVSARPQANNPLPPPQLLMLVSLDTVPEANAWTSGPGRTILGVFVAMIAINQVRRGEPRSISCGALAQSCMCHSACCGCGPRGSFFATYTCPTVGLILAGLLNAFGARSPHQRRGTPANFLPFSLLGIALLPRPPTASARGVPWLRTLWPSLATCSSRAPASGAACGRCRRPGPRRCWRPRARR
jgi:hypothetical protein